MFNTLSALAKSTSVRTSVVVLLWTLLISFGMAMCIKERSAIDECFASSEFHKPVGDLLWARDTIYSLGIVKNEAVLDNVELFTMVLVDRDSCIISIEPGADLFHAARQ